MATKGKGDVEERDANEDPITGEPGAHPVGAGLGAAAGGAAAGAAAGAAVGPIGTVAGAVIGGVAGGLAGKAIAEQIDPTTEEQYWRDEYSNREYYDENIDFEEVAPAYRYGWESRAAYHDRPWHEVEPELERGWAMQRGESSLEWDRARRPAREAWDRISESMRQDKPGQQSPVATGEPKSPRLPK